MGWCFQHKPTYKRDHQNPQLTLQNNKELPNFINKGEMKGKVIIIKPTTYWTKYIKSPNFNQKKDRERRVKERAIKIKPRYYFTQKQRPFFQKTKSIDFKELEKKYPNSPSPTHSPLSNPKHPTSLNRSRNQTKPTNLKICRRVKNIPLMYRHSKGLSLVSG